jgi:hypothetical protein
MDMAHPDEDEFKAARRDLIRSVAVLTLPAVGENTLLARNLYFHAEEFMNALDAFYAADQAAGTG